MSHCSTCNKDTASTENKFKDIVYSESGEYLTVYVYSCMECGEHKPDESYID